MSELMSYRKVCDLEGFSLDSRVSGEKEASAIFTLPETHDIIQDSKLNYCLNILDILPELDFILSSGFDKAINMMAVSRCINFLDSCHKVAPYMSQACYPSLVKIKE